MKEFENNDELRDLAPILSSIERKEVFSVPANYFDSLSDQIMERVSAPPVFEEITAANPFIVPENYFEGLPLDIIKRIEVSQSKKFSLAGLLAQVMRPKFSLTLITACFALLICIRFFEKPILLNVAQITAEVSISESDVLGEVDENTLMNVAAEENASVIKVTNNKSAGDKSVEDYIINNNIDISDIAKEL